MYREDKQAILDAICEALRLTSAAGTGNPLVEIRYIQKPNGTELARPIFENGTGEDGYYDVNITCDSGIAIFKDIVKQFINVVW